MDLWLAARVGDLERVRYLVEVKGHDVNGETEGGTSSCSVPLVVLWVMKDTSSGIGPLWRED